MLEPGQTVFIILSFEGPDVYSQAGGLGVRVKELSRALAERGYETHLFFVGDPNLPAHEALLDGRLTLHRWSQWISRFYPLGVYSGEDDKVADLNRSLPDALLKDYIRPAVERGNQVVVIGEEWHLAHAMTLISDALYFAGLRERCLLLWNANNHFSFHRINWGMLGFTTTLMTVSRYMKHIMWRWGVNPIVVPNGIPGSMISKVSQVQVRTLRTAVNATAFLFKIGRFSPDKRWHQAIAAVARLKERGTPAKMLMRGGMEPFGGEVLEYAGQQRLRVADLSTRVDDVAGLARLLKENADADIWNLTAFLYEEFNTANSRSNYTTGDIFHLDFTVTKTIGKWTLGPVGYYVAQVSDDNPADRAACPGNESTFRAMLPAGPALCRNCGVSNQVVVDPTAEFLSVS